jgi:hypothetical protein
VELALRNASRVARFTVAFERTDVKVSVLVVAIEHDGIALFLFGLLLIIVFGSTATNAILRASGAQANDETPVSAFCRLK